MPYSVIGLMSGTSLDGLDIAFCEFFHENNRWSFVIRCAETIPYSDTMKLQLSEVMNGPAINLVTMDTELGHFFGRTTRDFMKKFDIKPDFIASHGHTIYHQPDKRITCQIGNGATIAAETGVPVICDFRSLDVALGGQGAPLVPIGDQLLFGDYDYCLNIGGFANISFENKGTRIAFDTGPANIVLNHLASQVGHSFDPDGSLARSGKIDDDLLEQLNTLPYYSMPPPKSLGKEWVERNIMPLLEKSTLTVTDLLATFCEHIAIQIAAALRLKQDPKITMDDLRERTNTSASNQSEPRAARERLLITGGGALNLYLVARLSQHVQAEVVLPDPLVINFKEALIFAFLGMLRWRNEINCLRSVTGASRDSSGGCIY